MPNLNYDTIDDTLNVKIILYMKNDCPITIASLVNLLKVSRPTITRAIKHLQKDRTIERIGSNRSGTWKINN